MVREPWKKEEHKYDQYAQFENLPVLLKRFSFSEKMRIAHEYSRKLIDFNPDLFFGKKAATPLPWCLETFVMLSIEAHEYSNEEFKGKNINKFVSMCNAIYEADSFLINKNCGRFEFIDILGTAYGSTQFDIQEFFWIKWYRYWRIFTDNSEPVYLADIFKEKMGTEYTEYLLLCGILKSMFIAVANDNASVIPRKVIDYLTQTRFRIPISNLIVTREKYLELLYRYTKGSHEPTQYLYAVRPSYQYSFIEENGTIYFPLPHLLTRNITSSLLYRITEGDNKLRSEIGKHIWEKYLYEIINSTNAYDRVIREPGYSNNKSAALGPDVVARSGGDILFLDSKSTVPRAGVRLLDPEDIESNVDIVAENIEKLYKQIQRFDRYNPFSDFTACDMDNRWGIVVVLEDLHIQKRHYYDSACSKLGIGAGTPDWLWLTTHIRVATIYQIEEYCFANISLVEACKLAANDMRLELPYLSEIGKETEYINENFVKFKRYLFSEIQREICDMRDAGCFTL